MAQHLVDGFIGKRKFGFIGAGNLAGFIIDGLLQSGVLQENQILVSNRSEAKTNKLKETYTGISVCNNNDEVAEKSDVVFLGMKPQDLRLAVEPMRAAFDAEQIIVSLAAGIQLNQLKTILPNNKKIVRLMTNTPIKIQKAVIGFVFLEEDDFMEEVFQHMFKSLGLPIFVDTDEELDALAVACGSGPGFVFELMMVWTSWLEDYGYDAASAKEMAIMTFLGASMLADKNPDLSLQDLQNQVTSKKGVTFEGLKHLRSLETENSFSSSFEKAMQRSIELSKEFDVFKV